MPLSQQLKEISKSNTPLISCTTQVQEQYQQITCKNLGQDMYHLTINLIIWHLSSPMPVGLMRVCCI